MVKLAVPCDVTAVLSMSWPFDFDIPHCVDVVRDVKE